jgi:hypothetical protein
MSGAVDKGRPAGGDGGAACAGAPMPLGNKPARNSARSHGAVRGTGTLPAPLWARHVRAWHASAVVPPRYHAALDSSKRHLSSRSCRSPSLTIGDRQPVDPLSAGARSAAAGGVPDERTAVKASAPSPQNIATASTSPPATGTRLTSSRRTSPSSNAYTSGTGPRPTRSAHILAEHRRGHGAADRTLVSREQHTVNTLIGRGCDAHLIPIEQAAAILAPGHRRRAPTPASPEMRRRWLCGRPG